MKLHQVIFLFILISGLAACAMPARMGPSEIAPGFTGPVDNILIMYNGWAFGKHKQFVKQDKLQELAQPFINNGIRANVLYINHKNESMFLQMDEIAKDYDYELLITPIEFYVYDEGKNVSEGQQVDYALYLTSTKTQERVWVTTLTVTNISSNALVSESIYEQYTYIANAILERMYEDGIVHRKPILENN